jgi:methylase of polypeptide subunit release factors
MGDSRAPWDEQNAAPHLGSKDLREETSAVANGIDDEAQLRIWERAIPDDAFCELLERKLKRKSPGQTPEFSPAIAYDGLVVFDSPTFFGGGTVHAPDFLRVLIELGIGRCERLCDFCSGVGYIGYSLLARRYCKTLCCVDVNAKSIEAVRVTAEFNGVSDLVIGYVSDVLRNVPSDERWDIVVCNPPQLLPRVVTDTDTAITFDPHWHLHRTFYANLKSFMNPGGLAIVMEARYESDATTFEAMIKGGGGRIVAALPAKDFRGREDDRYFLITQW